MIFSHSWEGEPHNSPSIKRMMNPKDPYYTHEWMGEPHNSPSTRREVWPGDPEYTYAWEGEVGKSPSLKYRDGELVARNLSNAPAKVNDEYSTVAVEYTQEQFTYMSMIESQEGSTPYVGLTRMDVTPGEYFATGVDFRWGEGIGRVRHQIQFRGPNNESISAPQTQRDFIDYPEGGRSIFVERVPAGATEARIYTWFYLEGSFTPAPSGSTVHVGGYVNAVGISEKEAREQVEEPFDGDTKSHRGRIVAENRYVGGDLKGVDPLKNGYWSALPIRDRKEENGITYISQNYGWETRTDVPLERNTGYIALIFYARVGLSPEGSGTSASRISGFFRDENNEAVKAPDLDSNVYHIMPSDNIWRKYVVYSRIPEEAAYLKAYILARDNDGSTSIDYSRFMVVYADTETEIIEKTRKYFDGDTPDEYGEILYKNHEPPIYSRNYAVGIYADIHRDGDGTLRGVCTTVIDNSILPRIQVVTKASARTRIKPGQYYAIAIESKHSRGLPVYISGWVLDKNANRVGNSINGTKPIGTDFSRSVTSAQAGEGAERVGYQIRVDSSTELGPSYVGDEFWIRKIHIAVADTEEEALRQVERYFDGDTKDYGLAQPKIWITDRWVPYTPTHFM